MVRKGDLNYSITLITINLLILRSGPTAQIPHNPASIVRLLYGEHYRRKNRAEAFSLNPATNSLTSALPIGQGQSMLRPSVFPPVPPALPSYPAASGPATSPASMSVHSSFQNCYPWSRSISLFTVIAPLECVDHW